MPKITINLWFDDQAEEAANFYASIFPNSTVHGVAYFPDAGQEITGKAAGEAMTVPFELDGQSFVGLNGGKAGFSFSEAISLIIPCETQEEIDHYWTALTANGGQESQCGWLKDKYGVSWQVVPPRLDELLASPDSEVAKRVMTAMLKMKKINLSDLEAAAK